MCVGLGDSSMPPAFYTRTQVIGRWGMHMTVASFAVYVSAFGGVHACALRLIPLPQQ